MMIDTIKIIVMVAAGEWIPLTTSLKYWIARIKAVL